MTAREEGAIADRLRRIAAEAILEAANSTDELADEEARPLIAWSLSQGEAAADAVANSADLDPMTAGQARKMLSEQVAPVRRLMREINGLAGERGTCEPQQVYERLEAIRALAEELPVPGGAAVSDTALAELAAWQAGLDNGDFVGALLYLLQGRGTEE